MSRERNIILACDGYGIFGVKEDGTFYGCGIRRSLKQAREKADSVRHRFEAVQIRHYFHGYEITK